MENDQKTCECMDICVSSREKMICIHVTGDGHMRRAMLTASTSMYDMVPPKINNKTKVSTSTYICQVQM